MDYIKLVDFNFDIHNLCPLLILTASHTITTRGILKFASFFVIIKKQEEKKPFYSCFIISLIQLR